MQLLRKRSTKTTCAAIVSLTITAAGAMPACGQETDSPAPLTTTPTSSPATGATGNLGQLFGGNTFPLTFKLKELTGDWRRVNVVGQLDLGGYTQVLSTMMASVLGSMGSTVYYTRGETITLGSEIYLVAYRPPVRPIDIGGLIQEAAKGGMNTKPDKKKMEELAQKLVPPKLTEETALTMTLLNLRTSGTLSDIRPFELQREIDEAPTGVMEAVVTALKEEIGGELADAPVEDTKDASLSNLKQVGVGLLMYVQDYDEVLPPMNNPDTAKQALIPYVKNADAFVHPETKEPYQPSAILGRKKLLHIAVPAQFVAFYEAKPAADNTRGVLFLDGRVKRIREEEWPRLARASKIAQ